MLHNQPRRALWRILATNTLDKVALGIHQVEINAVVDQIVFAGCDILWRAEIHTVRFTHLFHLLVGSREADDIRMELGEVFFEHLRSISSGIAGDEYGFHDLGAVRGGFDVVDDGGHFVELIGADVGAVREAKVHLCNH